MFPAPVLDALRISPSRTAIEHGGREITRGDLLTAVARIATGLRAAGLGPGKGVAMMTSTSPDAYAAHLAAHALGCRVAAFRPRWSADQIAHALAYQFDALIVDPGTHAAYLKVPNPDSGPRMGDPGVRSTDLKVPSPDSGPRMGDPGVRSTDLKVPDLDARLGDLRVPVLDTAKLLDHPADPLTIDARPGDIARLTFTSGSTGQPKGCAQTYRAFSLAYQRDDWPPQLAALMTHFQRCLVHESLASPVMMTYLGRCLVTGGTAIMTSEPLTPDLIDRHRVTATMMPPPRLHVLLATLHQRPADLSTLRAVVLGGSPADPGLLTAAMDRLGPIIWQGYGQAEGGVISMLTPTDITTCPDALTTVGRPLPTVELSVRNYDNRPGTPGEIWVRSPHMMTRYWNDPDQTAEVLQDGWLHTRDIGYVGPDGLLRLTGRSRDVILVNAEVCYPTAIERVLTTHPSVSAAYVTSTPDPTTGDAIHAFVVPTPGHQIDNAVLQSLIQSSLSKAHTPKTITVLTSVPTTPAGKPDMRALAALLPLLSP
ncbi:fatty acid--CoA ligase family protein [Acrocarpospora macrocephala]|uniref:AMP-dependent synthetase n=1 Tax=Acrocarpospora macrocephala TaxID=150177 RepID=A0A5M3WUM7_9ACTN|nr:long-chain fatty acid--CoA ligase [Acrocarpospora macrocephala]GES09838.1 AMP-dependent synthetase [Acrocarpospora macrocephala]